jgi:arsenate reductase-like glutaredoxin family protein
LTVAELEDISQNTGIEIQRMISLKNIKDKELEEKFTQQELKELTNALGKNFEELFEN